ncbi:TPA: DUF2786 domain-containing protein [Morganella morganii]|nr:DUF2786 domain-containing protein [Morganella morganii]
MDDREKAVEKVRKLMSLAESAGNENEAANAFSKARVFMKKYHLELSDIYSAEPSPPPPSPRREAPPRPLTPEERHREMTQLKQQEEQRLREFQKVAEQQQQRKRQRESGSSRHCGHLNGSRQNSGLSSRQHRHHHR